LGGPPPRVSPPPPPPPPSPIPPPPAVSNPDSALRGHILPTAGAAVKSAAATVHNEVANPDSVLRSSVLPTATAAVKSAAATVHNEVTNPESRLRAELLPTAKAAVKSAATTMHNEVTNPESRLRAELLPGAAAAARTVAHEVADKDSTFRTQYVAPAAAAAASAAKTVAHEVTDKDSTFRTQYVAPAAAATAATAAALVHEVADGDSRLRSELLPAAAARASEAAAAVKHEFVDPESVLRHDYLAPIGEELRHPTVAGVAGGVAAGVTLVGKGAKAALVATAEVAGTGVELVVGGLARGLGRVSRPVQVSDTTRARLAGVRNAAGAAAMVTSGMVFAATQTARLLGAAASRALSGTAVEERAHSTAGRAVRRIAIATVGAAGSVWEGLEGAASALGKHSAAAARGFVEARGYGEDVRAATEMGIDAATQAAAVATNLVQVTPGMIAANAAGNATTNFVAAVEHKEGEKPE
jgi:hypothetical protein